MPLTDRRDAVMSDSTVTTDPFADPAGPSGHSITD